MSPINFEGWVLRPSQLKQVLDLEKQVEAKEAEIARLKRALDCHVCVHWEQLNKKSTSVEYDEWGCVLGYKHTPASCGAFVLDDGAPTVDAPSPAPLPNNILVTIQQIRDIAVQVPGTRESDPYLGPIIELCDRRIAEEKPAAAPSLLSTHPWFDTHDTGCQCDQCQSHVHHDSQTAAPNAAGTKVPAPSRDCIDTTGEKCPHVDGETCHRASDNHCPHLDGKAAAGTNRFEHLIDCIGKAEADICQNPACGHLREYHVEKGEMLSVLSSCGYKNCTCKAFKAKGGEQ